MKRIETRFIQTVKKTCRYFGIARSTFYEWRNQYKNRGIEGLARKKTGSVNHPERTPNRLKIWNKLPGTWFELII